MQINSIETELTWLSHDSEGVSSSYSCFLKNFDSMIMWLVLCFPQRIEFNMTVSDLEVKQRKVLHDNVQVWPAYPLFRLKCPLEMSKLVNSM